MSKKSIAKEVKKIKAELKRINQVLEQAVLQEQADEYEGAFKAGDTYIRTISFVGLETTEQFIELALQELNDMPLQSISYATGDSLITCNPKDNSYGTITFDVPEHLDTQYVLDVLSKFV